MPGVALPSTRADSPSFTSEQATILFVFTTQLLRETYSPEVVKLAMIGAVRKCRALGTNEDDLLVVMEAIERYWNANRMFAGMF